MDSLMKLFALISVAGAALVLSASLAPSSLLEKQASVLKGVKSLNVSYTVWLSGVKSEYTLRYSKPNLFVIDSAGKLVESDGKTIWEYNKTAKTYTEVPATPELLANDAEADDVLAWASFFTDDFLSKASNEQVVGPRAIKGVPTTQVSFSFGRTNPKTVTLYVDDKLGIARGFSFTGEHGDVLAMVDKVEMGSDAMGADQFAFSAPAGVTKVMAPVPGAPVWANVQQILNSNCLPCHGAARATSGFSIESYATVMKGSNSGPVITPGDPDNSRLVQFITGTAQPKMPPRRSVSDADITTIKDWIKAGAKEQG